MTCVEIGSWKCGRRFNKALKQKQKRKVVAAKRAHDLMDDLSPES